MEKSIAAVAKEVSAGVGEAKRLKGPMMRHPTYPTYDSTYSDYYDQAEPFDEGIEEASSVGWRHESFFRRHAVPYGGLF